MIKIDITICNKLGLHARAATKFANEALRYGSKINVECNGKNIDGKSIMSLMLLAASKGTELSISAEGNDETEAIGALQTLINNKFDEGE